MPKILMSPGSRGDTNSHPDLYRRVDTPAATILFPRTATLVPSASTSIPNTLFGRSGRHRSTNMTDCSRS